MCRMNVIYGLCLEDKIMLHVWNKKILNKVFGESEPRTERITHNS